MASHHRTVFIIVLLATVVSANSCILTNNGAFPDFFSDSQPLMRLNQRQVIIPSYQFQCCGTVAEWGIRVFSRTHQTGPRLSISVEFQVWRSSPKPNTTDCYSLVGRNRFPNVRLRNGIVTLSPPPHKRIQVQPGDAAGFYMYVQSSDSRPGHVAVTDSQSPKEAWLVNRTIFESGSYACPYPNRVRGGLYKPILGAPVISASLALTHSCSPSINSQLSSSQPYSQSNPQQSNTGIIVGSSVAAILVILLLFTATMVTALLIILKRRVPHHLNLTPPSFSSLQHEKETTSNHHESNISYMKLSEQSFSIQENQAYTTATSMALAHDNTPYDELYY